MNDDWEYTLVALYYKSTIETVFYSIIMDLLKLSIINDNNDSMIKNSVKNPYHKMIKNINKLEVKEINGFLTRDLINDLIKYLYENAYIRKRWFIRDIRTRKFKNKINDICSHIDNGFFEYLKKGDLSFLEAIDSNIKNIRICIDPFIDYENIKSTNEHFRKLYAGLLP